jgi:glycosyltransferase involved in cell wall biosynthesis
VTRVIYFINGFIRGGAEKGLIHLVENGAFEGTDLRVVAIIRGTGEYLTTLRELGVDVEVYWNAERMGIGHWLRSLGRLRALLAREKPDVLILSLPQANIVGRLAALFSPRTVVASFEHNTHLAKRLYEWLFRFTSFRVNWVLADCEATAAEARRRLYWREPPRTNVLSLTSFPAAGSNGQGSPPRFTIVNAGRFTRTKNQAAIIDALAILRARGRDVQAVLFGEGALREACIDRAGERGVSDRVVFAGYTGDWFNAPGSVFVVASLHEGLCMVALEAMNAGLPVIAPRVGGLRDYGEDARVLWIKAPTGEAIAAAVERAMDDPSLLQTMRDAGRRTVDARFGDQRVAADYAAFAKALRSLPAS